MSIHDLSALPTNPTGAGSLAYPAWRLAVWEIPGAPMKADVFGLQRDGQRLLKAPQVFLTRNRD